MSKTPLRLRTGLGMLGLVLLGMLVAFGGTAGLHATNRTEFCISCHEMKDHNYAEYSHTIHASNRTGVQAGCSDCHVPHEFPDVLWRKIGAAKDVWGHLSGEIDTPERFEQHRLAMAQQVWRRMKATDSRECRNCHNVQAMNPELQGKTAQKQHKRLAAEGKTCIDCHYGIAHQEPQGGDPSDLDAAPGSAAASAAVSKALP